MAFDAFLKVAGIPICAQQKREDNYADENVSGGRAFPETHSSPDYWKHTYA